MDTPDIVAEGWDAWGGPQRIVGVEEISASVSTNRVYRVRLDDGRSVVAKASSYGSFVHFRQDHERIHAWSRGLRKTRFEGALADVLHRGDVAFVHQQGPAWIAFYEDVGAGEPLPAILDEADIGPLAREIAAFHRASAAVGLDPTWKSLGSDIARLREHLEHPEWCEARGIGRASAHFLREHCDAFLWNTDRDGYHGFDRVPLLVDWNLGNFSIARGPGRLHLASRWDYDWFRIEPRVLDFYFLSRVVSARGDRTVFTYDADSFADPRFVRFLEAYHEVWPLSPAEIAFVREAYRFFLLNYAVLQAEHFFRPALCERLRADVIERHLPAIDEIDLEPLLEVVRR